MSEQLQNERTTVSRAVAQNQELKAQLIELQDRFVQLTNDCAEKEDERITSLATIERLRHQIEDIVSSKNHLNQARKIRTVAELDPQQYILFRKTNKFNSIKLNHLNRHI